MTEKTFLTHNSEYHDKMEDMKGPKSPWFMDTFRDVFIVGMCYAAKKDLAPIELDEGKKRDSIRIGEVIHDEHMFLFRVVALYYTKDYRVLTDKNTMYELVEKLSNAGIKDLIDKYYKKSDYPNFDLAQIVMEQKTKPE